VIFIRSCGGCIGRKRASAVLGAEAMHLVGRMCLAYVKVRVQKYSSDTLFTPKMDIFKQTILNTAYIKTLEIFPSARESLSIQTCKSRSVRNQIRLQGS